MTETTDGASRAEDRPAGAIRVLLVVQPTIGGAAVQVWQLATSLDRTRYAVTVVSPDDGWLRPRLLDAGIRHETLPLAREIRPLREARLLLGLWSLIRRENPHLVHGHSSKAGFLARLAGALARTPVVVYTPHGLAFAQASGARRRLYLGLEKLAARFGDRIVCVSESERAQALAARVAPAEKLIVIRNGVDAPADPQAGSGHLRRLLGVGQDTHILAMVSRLRRPKRPEDLIRAAAVLAGRQPAGSFRCVLIGSGPLESDLRELRRQLGLEREVVLLGERSDVPSLLADVDVFVLASASEGMPYTVLEAMAAAKPVVGARVPGVTDLIAEGVTGLCYAPGDAGELAGHLQALLRDAGLRRRFGARGRELVETDYASRRMVAEIGAEYGRLLAAKLRRAGRPLTIG